MTAPIRPPAPAGSRPRRRHRRPLDRRLVAVVFTSILFLAACGGSSDETAADAATTTGPVDGGAGDGASGSGGDDDAADGSSGDATDDAIGDEGDGDEDGDAGGDDGADTSGGESDAMGEDEPSSTSTTTTVTDPDDSGATSELEQAVEAGSQTRFISPYIYATAEQDCEGCAEVVSLYFVPGTEVVSRHVLTKAWVDGVEQSLDVVAPLLQTVDPLFVADELLARQTSGVVVDSRIDGVSGLVVRWTLPDEGTVSLRCLQVDTASIDLRDPLCSGGVIG